MTELTLSEIWIYPIKSLGGMSVNSSDIDDFGLQYDRRWMLVDETGEFLTQRNHPKLSRLQVTIHARHLHIINKDYPKEFLAVPIDIEDTQDVMVNVWSDRVKAQHLGESFDAYFSNFLGFPVRLVYMPEGVKRRVDGRYTETPHQTAFTDGFPFLGISESSLEALNARLETPVSMQRFRPNLVFKGGAPHFEDELGTFILGECIFQRVKPCSRCVMTTIDLDTGQKGAEPLKTLATYRKKNGKIYFGQNLICTGGNQLMVGDVLTNTEQQKPAEQNA